MQIGTTQSFDFDDPPPPAGAPPHVPTKAAPKRKASPKPAPEPMPLPTVAVVAPLPGAKLTWTGSALPASALKQEIEVWNTIFGSRWRDYLNAALAARDAGEQADAALQRIAMEVAENRHQPGSLAGLLRGAGIARTSDEAMTKYRRPLRNFAPPIGPAP